jgi:hypothetical protein
MGYTLENIVCVVLEMEEIKKSRSDSLNLTNREKLIMAMDSAGRTLRKVARANKHDKPNTARARSA